MIAAADIRERSVYINVLAQLIIAQTTTKVTGTRQLNKEVCDKTRNTLVFCFSGRKKKNRRTLTYTKHLSMSN
jgi:hypothetical protein